MYSSLLNLIRFLIPTFQYFLQWLRYGYPDDLMFTVETLDGGQNDQNEDDSGTEAVSLIVYPQLVSLSH